jgi:hypothetical protein
MAPLSPFQAADRSGGEAGSLGEGRLGKAGRLAEPPKALAERVFVVSCHPFAGADLSALSNCWELYSQCASSRNWRGETIPTAAAANPRLRSRRQEYGSDSHPNKQHLGQRRR